MSLKWEDETSHSRGRTDRAPRTWSARVGKFPRLVVTRHIHIEPTEWLVRALDVERILKGDKSADEAKAYAENLMRTMLLEALAVLGGGT